MLNKPLWDQLETSHTRPSGLVALRLLPQSRLNLFASIEPSTGHRFLLLKSNRTDFRVTTPLPSGRGFLVQAFATAGDPEGSLCLQMELTEPAHSDVFDAIGNDVIKCIVECPDDKTAFATFVARIVEWQTFLDQLSHAGLSEPAQQGLFAELWFIREVLLNEMAPDTAIHSWAGPKSLTKDFQFPGIAVEVKTTSAKQPTRFTISSELQLDPQGVGRLILFCLLMERLAAGGMSLPELVAAIKNVLQPNPVGANLFSELLIKTGYQDADAAQYTMRFAVRSQHYFDVTGNFPRIVEKDLRQGVGDVHYTIMLSECAHYAISEEEARALIRAATP